MLTQLIKTHLKNVSSGFLRIFPSRISPRAVKGVSGRRFSSSPSVSFLATHTGKALQELASQAWQEMPQGGGWGQLGRDSYFKRGKIMDEII